MMYRHFPTTPCTDCGEPLDWRLTVEESAEPFCYDRDGSALCEACYYAQYAPDDLPFGNDDEDIDREDEEVGWEYYDWLRHRHGSDYDEEW